MKKNKEDQLSFVLLIVMAIVIPIILAISYGYIQAKNNNEEFEISNENVEIELITENEYISATDLSLIESNNISKDSKKHQFKVVTGPNEQYISYNLSLSDLTISSNLRVSDFKWQLLRGDTTISNGTFKGITENNMNLAKNLQIDKNTIDDFELRIWLEKTDNDQQKLLNGTFSAKLLLVENK